MLSRGSRIFVWLASLALGVGGWAAGDALAQEHELGRLFFTPQQRQDLDRRRASNVQAAATAVTIEDLVSVNGRVSRSSGKTTTWLNGIPQEDTHRGPDASRVTIKQGDDASVSVKVGETLDRVKSETKDALNGGKIAVRRSAPR